MGRDRSGLGRGRLPIEVSTRGAKFAEEVDQPGELAESKLEDLERTTRALTEGLTDAYIEIEELREAAAGDSTQPGVSSQPRRNVNSGTLRDEWPMARMSSISAGRWYSSSGDPQTPKKSSACEKNISEAERNSPALASGGGVPCSN